MSSVDRYHSLELALDFPTSSFLDLTLHFKRGLQHILPADRFLGLAFFLSLVLSSEISQKIDPKIPIALTNSRDLRKLGSLFLLRIQPGLRGLLM
jgi:hypothetical protein